MSEEVKAPKKEKIPRQKMPEQLPKVGPEALPLDGARHLAVAQLEAWDERRMWHEPSSVAGGRPAP